MIQRIKTWFSNYREKRRKKQILKIIKKAKQVYLDGKSPFMCVCFQMVYPYFYYNNFPFFCYNDIVREIPEFKPSTFGLHVDNINRYWWPISDRASRIKAFDKLIEIYSK